MLVIPNGSSMAAQPRVHGQNIRMTEDTVEAIHLVTGRREAKPEEGTRSFITTT